MLIGTAKPRSAKKIPEFMRSFGWCTWDAFYSQVSAQGITLWDVSRSRDPNAEFLICRRKEGFAVSRCTTRQFVASCPAEKLLAKDLRLRLTSAAPLQALRMAWTH